jgi:hypothetical protein
MIDNPMRRVAAIMLVALMLISTLVVVFPQSTASAASETNDIIIPVTDGSNVVTNGNVDLTEVHTGNVVHATYNTSVSSYVASGAPSGYYRIDVSASGYFSYADVDGFRFDGTVSYTRTPEIQLQKLGASSTWPYTYTVTVKDKTTTLPIAGATVMFYNSNPNIRQMVISNITDANGLTHLKVMGSMDLDLVASADNHEMNVTHIGIISANANVIMKLNASSAVSGFAFKDTGGIAQNVVAYLYNTSSSVSWEKRVLRSEGSFISFDAYDGEWILVADGSDVDPYVANITISGGLSLSMRMRPQNQTTELATITMQNWNSMTINISANWRTEKTYPGLAYADIGSLAAQVDLTLGNADGMISGTEYNDFIQLLTDQGPNYVTTSSLLHAQEVGGKNKTQYISSASSTILVTSLSGAIVSPMNISYNSSVSYTTQVTLSASAGYLQITPLVVPLDSASMNRSFNIALVSGFELVANSTDTSLVSIGGYTVVKVDPKYSAVAGYGHLTLSIGLSRNPVAVGEIKAAPNTYAKMADQNVSFYVVKLNTNVTFLGTKSYDPNNNPLTYMWNFGDGNTTTTKSSTTWHNYTTSAKRVVWLNVTDVVGKVNFTSFNVSVDGFAPRPAVEIKNSTSAVLTQPVTIDQGTALKFSPLTSKDDLIALNDGNGIIDSYEWKFGTDAPFSVSATEAEQNQTYSFGVAGQIKVVLNVTDSVGNYKNLTITITVKDKTAPTVDTIAMLNSTWGITLFERSTIYFNASKATDNIDNVSALNFNWSFGDKSSKIGGTGLAYANVTHNYSSFGQYNLVLNVTDTAGNNVSVTRTIYVGMGPRPNIYPDKVTFAPILFEEGVTGKITVNITNKGSKAATDIKIEVWWYDGTIAQELIGNITTIYDANGTQITSLGIGESGYGYIEWTPSAKGNYTIRAIANASDQPETNWASGQINVKQAGWKDIALPVGLLVAILAVILILVARRMMGSMGTRRPKKERESRKEEKKEVK